MSICTKPPKMPSNRMPSRPYISGDGFRAFADHVYDETDRTLQADEIAPGDIVFVRAAMLDAFFAHIHPNIVHRYILVSHNADTPTPGKFLAYLQNDKLAKWFGQNPTIRQTDAFIPIPIGIANGYVKNLGVVSHFKPYSAEPNANKHYLLGMNFKPGTNKSERQSLFNAFRSKPFCRDISSRSHVDYLRMMHQAKYILSPPGNGFDCHRTWEALIVGTIPIVKSSCLDALLSDLPVLIVDDWPVVDEQFLHMRYEQMEQLFYTDGMKKITYAYWHERIKRCQQELREISGGKDD